MPIGFARLVHADWSTHAGKRWVAEASREGGQWEVSAPYLVGEVTLFLDELLIGPQPALAGFDFPIGLPASFGNQTEFSSFGEAISALGTGYWSRFYDVCDSADEISVSRPFYPRVSTASARQVHLLNGLNVADIDALRRSCERATADRRAACSLFWTLGGNQVGKAAISGWRDIVQPARKRGALLWPFDGELSELVHAKRLVIAETYPGEAYGHVGIRFRADQSKQRQADRCDVTSNLGARCRSVGIRLSPDMARALADGFGPRKDGEDPFDAVVGLLGMIEVADGRRGAGQPRSAAHWEGWILGQT